MKFINNFLKFIRLLIVVIVPIVTLQYFLHFNTESIWKNIKSGADFLKLIDYNLIIQLAPWIIGIILISIAIRIVEAINEKAKTVTNNIQLKSLYKIQKNKIAIEEENSLKDKQATYLAIELVFSKFTMTSASEEEIENKKADVKAQILETLYLYHGKLLEYEDNENNYFFPILFYSQDEAIEYLMQVNQQISFLDDEAQQYGYSLGLKATLDVQMIGAIESYVVEFLSKIINTLDLNEICTTVDFAKRYALLGKNKNYSFISKGNYSINKSRVELITMNFQGNNNKE